MTEPSVRIAKLPAALRQLDAAIRLLFDGEDPVAVHTLVGAASILLTDLIDHRSPDRSWDRQAQAATGLTPSEYFRVMRKAQNFLKHARNDHEAELDFDPTDTESLAFWAVLNASELAPLTLEMQIFQLWYVASNYPDVDPADTPLKEAIALFGDLRGVDRDARLKSGQRLLREMRAENAA